MTIEDRITEDHPVVKLLSFKAFLNSLDRVGLSVLNENMSLTEVIELLIECISMVENLLRNPGDSNRFPWRNPDVIVKMTETDPKSANYGMVPSSRKYPEQELVDFASKMQIFHFLLDTKQILVNLKRLERWTPKEVQEFFLEEIWNYKFLPKRALISREKPDLPDVKMAKKLPEGMYRRKPSISAFLTNVRKSDEQKLRDVQQRAPHLFKNSSKKVKKHPKSRRKQPSNRKSSNKK